MKLKLSSGDICINMCIPSIINVRTNMMNLGCMQWRNQPTHDKLGVNFKMSIDHENKIIVPRPSG